MRPEDLAAGDSRSLGLDCRELEIACVRSSGDPHFAEAFDRLWAEFGSQYEMERREVLEQRLAWHPAAEIGGCWMRYEIFLVRRKGTFVAARDHTAVVTAGTGAPRAVVHLSHVLIDPQWRRTGLGGWLRAWPIQTARACLHAAGFPPDSPITLAAEMEHPAPGQSAPLIRLKAYERAGFKKVDPSRVNYFQPDFRPVDQIDASGGPRPLPFGLVLRRLGREHEESIRGAEIRDIVQCLYRMYATGFRERDMTVLWASLGDYPGDETEIALVAPTR
jgi:GNAT superfamily N-acetyltransferase